MRKALIETTTGMVVNIIEIEDGANWQPLAGHEIQDALKASPGDTWDGVKFIPPPPAPPPIDWKAQWVAADTAAKKLSVIAKRLGLE